MNIRIKANSSSGTLIRKEEKIHLQEKQLCQKNIVSLLKQIYS